MIKLRWDYLKALGDTLMEKYESLYLFLHEIKVNHGEIKMILTSPEVSGIFETVSYAAFKPPQTPIVLEQIEYVGKINDRDIFKSNLVPKNEMLVFCDDAGDLEIASVEILNFIE